MASESVVGATGSVDGATEELQYDEMFKTRYTDEDEEYMATVNAPAQPPPCVKNWFPKSRGNFRNRGGYQDRGDRRGGYNRDNYNNRRGHHHGYREDRRGYREDHRGYREDNRGYREHGSGGYNQGHYHDNRSYGGYRDRDQR
ncbi:RNA guanine-N7 methyltransferase activating subunit-like [Ostrea edulis]|uniref:RNA guanine-N7 methyltransferase activating subunit-like n=1 Tax=Ostrea edulis TaxID=37623 RepID=UPI0024AEBE2D|nr:RNA guanine-N7 methyltransferase activating subunit-like [Ostrea edulis]